MKKIIGVSLLVVSVFACCTACTFWGAYDSRDNSSREPVSSVSSPEEQSSDQITAESSDENSTPSQVESRVESSLSDVTITVDKKDLDNWGSFSSVHKLRNHLKRNLENPLYVIATVEGLVVRADSDRDIYVVNEPENGGVAWTYAKVNLLGSEMLEHAGDLIKVNMKDDTKNRVLTGDYIKLTGVLNTSDFQFFDAEYEMIKAVE